MKVEQGLKFRSSITRVAGSQRPRSVIDEASTAKADLQAVSGRNVARWELGLTSC